jgi:hypothetical protein
MMVEVKEFFPVIAVSQKGLTLANHSPPCGDVDLSTRTCTQEVLSCWKAGPYRYTGVILGSMKRAGLPSKAELVRIALRVSLKNLLQKCLVHMVSLGDIFKLP